MAPVTPRVPLSLREGLGIRRYRHVPGLRRKEAWSNWSSATGCVTGGGRARIVADRIAITGAGGFVGRHLAVHLAAEGRKLNLAVRTATSWPIAGDVRFVAVGDIGAETDWTAALEDCEAIVHLAAKVPGSGAEDRAFEAVNDQGTARLVAQAGNVRLLVLLSSVFAVTGRATTGPVNEDCHADPATPYGRSKLAAERQVASFGGHSIVLRPPLVYGAGVRGNWRLLEWLAATGLPLPFGSVNNRRSLICIHNLVDAVAHLLSLRADGRISGTFMVADNEAVSLSQILRWLRAGMGVPERLWPMPKIVLETALLAMGRGAMAQSLLGDLEVDAARFRATFGWAPKLSAEDGIVQAGAAFMAGRRTR